MSKILHRISSDLLRSDATGRTLFGTAVPYGVATLVDDGLGAYREMFAPGAFARSIRQRGDQVRLFTQHDRRRLPIGRATELLESDAGLHAAFEVARTRDGDDALELVNSGLVNSFSVAFGGISEHIQDGVVVRTEASLREVSLVDSPAYQDARVAGVRSAVLTHQLSVDFARRRLNIILESW